ncbi:homocysteine S-methyltransferase family protein [Paracoccus sp. JM45]|uniref:homocysteine S-methyltransferase family protein n=1 Tax=Paracoccus sp. JM45 TaxID=2283626 RepID=UPI000E6BCD26|nr:homocysteine S-methyltransferase family protein [Paracoccus sp. JM45]RJE80025.1 homocysteine S-methyltransferase family protein [Paracoccus sp. JM45]
MTQITLLDGGMSRELERCGAILRQPEWSALALMNQPQIVQKAHEEFIAAGAQIIIANNYAVVPFHLGQDRFDQDGAMLAARAGHLARQAANTGDRIRVAGSLPPVCGSYQPENLIEDDAKAILKVLVDNMAAYVDLWLGETLSSLAEARITAEAVAGSDLPLWISYTLRDSADDAPALRSGESVADAVRLAVSLGAKAVLFNCSAPEAMQPAIIIARDVIAETGSSIPVGVYANAFTPEDEGAANEAISSLREDLSPEGYTIWMDRWIAAGATIIGGCCGIDAPHIAAMKCHLKNHLQICKC